MNRSTTSRMSDTLQYKYETNAGELLIDMDYRIVVSPETHKTPGWTEIEIVDYYAVRIVGEPDVLLRHTAAGAVIEDLVSHLYEGCREFREEIDRLCLEDATATC